MRSQKGRRSSRGAGREVAVVLGIDEYRRLRDGKPDFKQFLMNGPDFDLLDIQRSTEPAREVDL